MKLPSNFKLLLYSFENSSQATALNLENIVRPQYKIDLLCVNRSENINSLLKRKDFERK